MCNSFLLLYYLGGTGILGGGGDGHVRADGFSGLLCGKNLLSNHYYASFQKECPFFNLRAQLFKQYLKFDPSIYVIICGTYTLYL